MLYVIAIGVGLVAPRIGVALSLVTAVYVMIPLHAIARWFGRRAGR